MKNWTPLLVIIGFALGLITLSGACRCRFVLRRQRFCSSDFVAIVTITGQDVRCKNGHNCYQFRVKEDLKSNGTQGVAKIVSKDSSAACGRKFGLNTDWLIFGKKGTGSDEIPVGLCSGSQSWSNLEERVKNKILKDMDLKKPCL
jgi:hypothetical protein